MINFFFEFYGLINFIERIKIDEKNFCNNKLNLT